MFRTLLIGVALFAGHALREVEGQCEDGDSMYDFGIHHGDEVALGDDGPPGTIRTTVIHADTSFRFYGDDYTKIYANLNGQLSLGDANNPNDAGAITEFFPSPVAKQNPPFMTAFWNDLFLDGNPGSLFYRQTSNVGTLEKASLDVAKVGKNINPTNVVIATWSEVSSFDHIIKAEANTSLVAPNNTFQVVLIMDNAGLSFAFFNYYAVTWYLAHSLPAVAMLNQGRHSSQALNLFASGSDLMMELPQTCANAGVYGRFVIQTSLDVVKILDQPKASILSNCFFQENSLYDYGPGTTDAVITFGDDGPSGHVTFSERVTFYGAEHTRAYININGPVSFGNPFLQYWPSRDSVDEPPFVSAFWNDISLDPVTKGDIFYRLETDPETLERFKDDVSIIGRLIEPTELLIATWSEVKAFGSTEDDPFNTFQVVFGYEGNTSYTLLLYAYIGWYQDLKGHFAVSLFNKGASSGVALDAGPPPGPEWFLRQRRGNSVNKPGMFVYETHPPNITKHSPTCVCKINKRKWVTTYDGKKHPILHEQKTRISRYLKHKNPCKFQLTVSSIPTNGGDFTIQWIAFGFGVHEANKTKFDKNIAIQRFVNGTVEIRGRGFQQASTIHPPWNWTSSDNMTQVSIRGDEYSGWIINSTTCPFRVLYAPNCPDPALIFTISKAFYKDKYLVGMCQDCNGKRENDYRPCAEDPVDDWTFWQKIPDVSKTCREP